MAIQIRAVPALRNVFLFILLCLSSGFFLLHFTKQIPTAYAIGCDSYGYLKQEQLFKQKGFVQGLHTVVKDKEASFLVGVASKINGNFLTWSEMVAPHCHHYDKSTDQIVLQYPPGTGLFLSLLPEGKELQTLSIMMVASTVFLYCLTNLMALGLRQFFLSSLICYAVLTSILKFQVPSYSVPVTLTLLPWLVILLFFVKPNPNIKNISIAVLLGTLWGLFVDVRIASLLILPGAVGIFLVKFTENKLYARFNCWIVPMLATIFFCLATIPLLYANHLNAGGSFNSTYAVYDKELRFNNIDLFLNNIKYYLTDNSASIVAILAILFLLVQTAQHDHGRNKSKITNVLILILLFATNLTFYCLKPIAIDYYFLPVSVFCLYFGMLNLTSAESELFSSNQTVFKVIAGIFFLIMLSVFCFNRITQEQIQKNDINIPAQTLDKESILYAGITGGTLNYYLGKYTSKLDFGTHCMVEQLLGRVALAGKEQFIVNDTPKMTELIEGIGVDKFQKIGVFQDASATFEIYKYTNLGLSTLPLISCDLNVTKALASNISLTLSGETLGSQYHGIVTLANHGHQAFSTRPVAGPVKLSWRFVAAANPQSAQPWEARQDLTLMIAANSAYEIPFKTMLPREKGTYLLEVTLVQEGFAWFHEFGMKLATQTVVVN